MSSNRRRHSHSARQSRRQLLSGSALGLQKNQFVPAGTSSPARGVTFAEFVEEIQTIYDLIGRLDLKTLVDLDSCKAAAKHLSKRLDSVHINLQSIADHIFKQQCPVSRQKEEGVAPSTLIPYMLDDQGKPTDIVCYLHEEHPVALKLLELQDVLLKHKMTLKHVR